MRANKKHINSIVLCNVGQLNIVEEEGGTDSIRRTLLSSFFCRTLKAALERLHMFNVHDNN